MHTPTKPITESYMLIGDFDQPSPSIIGGIS